MLNDYFKLNKSFETVETVEQFLDLISHNKSVSNILFTPSTFSPARPANRITDKTFTNVSFAKKEIRSVEFQDCHFIDCLFIGTAFISCAFHDCTFVGCNMYKVSFTNTYIDPGVFEFTIDPIKYSNVGLGLFQQLLQNSAQSHQPDFARTAQYQFEKWKRYQYNYEYAKGDMPLGRYLSKWIPNWLFDKSLGYGIRMAPFIRLTALLLTVMWLINYYCWEALGLHVNVTTSGVVHSWPIAFYYTVVTMTTLGYGDITPTTSTGMILASIEAMIGLLWLSVLASIIIKRLTK